MKVLFMTMRKILPLNDGAFIYTYGILQYLYGIGAQIHFVSFYSDEDYSSDEISKLKELCCEVDSVKLTWQNTALNLSLKYPNNIRKYTRKDMKRKLNEIKVQENFDIVVIDHLQMFEYAYMFDNSKIVLVEHNVESNIWFEYAKKCSKITKQLVNRSAKMTLAYEKKAIKSADAVISIAETDAEFITQLTGRQDIAVMHPYNVYDIIKTKDDIEKRDNSILFIGSYGWYPNQKAADFLSNEVMPILRKKILGIKLYLVGKEPTEEIKQYGRDNKDIIVTGRVESVDPYIKKCDVFVNAMFEGSGMNIKMIEAMGKGIPVVTSVYGSRGIAITHDEEALIFENIESCVTFIETLINQKAKAKELSDKARQFYKQFIEPDDTIRRIFTE